MKRKWFQWLASEIVESGGEATRWEAEMTESRQRAELVKTFTAQSEAAYDEILTQLRRKNPDLPSLARRYQQAVAQDYFRSKLGEKVRKALLAKGE